MTRIYQERMTVEMDDEFVVFLIGMRVNKPWKIHKWLPVSLAMSRMLKELYAHPELGFLGHSGGGPGLMVQYWRSFEHLEAYARSQDHEHLPAWADYNKRVRVSGGDVGIWHETYLVGPDRYEAMYGSMPAFGLGKVGKLIPIRERYNKARDRLRQCETVEVGTTYR